MGPVHVSPDRGLRIVLVKHVILAAKEDGTVRIVHPVVGGKQMVLRAKRSAASWRQSAALDGSVVDHEKRAWREVRVAAAETRRNDRRENGMVRGLARGTGTSRRAFVLMS